MASRAARTIFSAAVRASARPTRVAQHISRRHNSTSSHGSSATSSDKPWIIGSAIVFGPLLLYLLSPSAKPKSPEHATHHEKDHGSTHAPEHESVVEAAPSAPPTEVKMADDEGKEENVAESLAAAEHEDVPKVGEVATENEPELPAVSATPDAESIEDSEPEVSSGGGEGDVVEPVKAIPTKTGESRETTKEGKTPK